MAYVVFGNYVNEGALRSGLAKLGKELRAWNAPGLLVPSRSTPPDVGDVLFFTEEDTLSRYLGREGFHFSPQTLSFPLDDKLEFSRITTGLGESPVPYWDSLRGDALPFPMVLKARHSWKEGRKLIRGFRCANAVELEQAIQALGAQHLPREWFFLQQWFGDGSSNCYSVAGFFDAASPDQSPLIVTQKISSRGSLGFTQLVLSVQDPAHLIERTRGFLSRLVYTGPFELEFIQDPISRKFYILELNPRFWMQHGIFIHHLDNAVIKHYLGIPTQPAPSPLAALYRPVLWVNSIELIRAVVLFWKPDSLKMLRLLLRNVLQRARVLLDPSLATAFKFLIQLALQKATRNETPKARRSV